MKIIAYIPVWKRPEVLLQHLMYNCEFYTPFYCLSEDDPYFKENEQLIKLFGHKYCIFDNDPLGNKQNQLIDLIPLEFGDYDYLIHINSDNLVNKDLFQLYAEEMENKTPIFGMSDVYFWEQVGKKRCVYLEKYNDSHCIGGGRMIHKSVIDAMKEKEEHIYTPSQQSGLDNNSRLNIKRVLNIDDKVIDTKGVPYIIDVKTYTNINPLTMMDSFLDRFVDHDIDDILEYFDKKIPVFLAQQLSNTEGFKDEYFRLIKTFDGNKKAFDFINNLHEGIFGGKRYSGYNTFRVIRDRKK